MFIFVRLPQELKRLMKLYQDDTDTSTDKYLTDKDEQAFAFLYKLLEQRENLNVFFS